MSFQEAEARFRWLERHRADLGEEAFYAELSKLCLQDEWGRWWMMQEGTGQWHVYQSGQWIPALSPSTAFTPGAPAVSTVYPQQQSEQYTPIAKQRADQVQCPNCGGYKIKVRDQGTGCALLWLIFGGWLFAAGGLFLAAFAFEGYGKTFLAGLGQCIGGILLIALGIGPLIFARLATNANLLECELCGNKWDNRTVPPNAQIQVRPDLIQKGEQRLREDEERARWAAAEMWRRSQK